ncbi:probable inorganic phosphate transporter 1-9 [Olea europaea subsp. europaea]|uniref:Probable inorganic phosphate transporter 1-9 n=1 Tax=Olea europaea subsp. europaea TaxID=158383 RepID=A0A8S0T8W8_OLEEU|nr:probable inorganic phosphate transporter 1-9 [Olea europaea subsp. europaea]
MALQVLPDLDSARTQYYHFKAIIVAGMGLLTDAYDLFCLPPIMRLLGRIYFDDSKKHKGDQLYEVPKEVISSMVGTALLGTVIGQLVFGYLGDRIGPRVYGLALMLMVLSSIGCGLSFSTSTTSVLSTLMFFRFVLGVGIGGDYPLSATIMLEFDNRKTRRAFRAAVFSMQGFGILMSSTVTMIVCAIFNRASNYPGPKDSAPESADLAWRLILMIGAVPAGLTYYLRMKMLETPRNTPLVERNVTQAATDISLSQTAEESLSNPPSYSLFSKEFLHHHGRDLFSCVANWFLVDVVFYSSNLFQSKIYDTDRFLPSKREVNVFEDAFQYAKLQAIIAICSTIPGYYATVYFIDRVGRVKIQIIGFFFMALGMFAIGIPYYTYRDNHAYIRFMFLYGLTFFFSNFGPNTTTFIAPAELFPARFRSTCQGISGAAGKIGAITGSVGFLWASQNEKKNGDTEGIGMTASLVILGGICILGMIVTYFFTGETNGISLEENENEDDIRSQIFEFISVV